MGEQKWLIWSNEHGAWWRPKSLGYTRIIGEAGILRAAGPLIAPGYLPNVWLGTSVEDQKAADERIPHLLATPAAVRFLSCEPLLGPVNLDRIHEVFDGGLGHSWESCLNGRRFDPWSDGMIEGCSKIDWVIVGGESGPNARPMHPDWARSIRDQCAAAGVPFFFKQWGNWQPFLSGGCEVGTFIAHGREFTGRNLHRFADGQYLAHVGKKAAGRRLEGVEHNGMPRLAA